MSSPNPNWTNEQLYDWLDSDPDFSLYSDAFKDNDVSVKEFYGLNLAKLMSYPYTLPLDIASRLEKIIQSKPALSPQPTRKSPSPQPIPKSTSPQPHILPPPARTRMNLGVSSSSPSLRQHHTMAPPANARGNASGIENNSVRTQNVAVQRPPQRSLKKSETLEKLSFLSEGKGVDGNDVDEIQECASPETQEQQHKTAEQNKQIPPKATSFATPGIHIDANTSIEEAQKLLGMMEAKNIGTTLMIGMESGKDKKRRSKDAAPILKPVKYVTEPCSVVFSNIATQQLDYWTSIPMEIKRWPVSTEKCEPLLISPSVIRNGFSLETWSHDDPDEPLENDTYETEIKGVTNYYNIIMRILEPDIEYEFYKTFLYRFPHENYITRLGDSPVVISVETNDLPRTKIIFRRKEGSRRIFANKKVDQLNISEFIPEVEGIKLLKVKEEGIKADLVRYDELFKVNHYKFGLLYVGPNQNNEDEIYSNRAGSPAYDEFLNFIGKVIQLKGHVGYRGGLNVTDNETGTHSVYTTYRDFEIMFHVCTMLPFQEHDAQRVERKRHIGNDVVVLVFKDQADENDYFDPQILTSHFNSCFFVVSPIKNKNGVTTSYRLNIANKSGITPYYPYFPEATSVFTKDEAFREFLLLKLVNSERIAMHSGEFVVNALNARKMQLNEILKKYEKKKH